MISCWVVTSVTQATDIESVYNIQAGSCLKGAIALDHSKEQNNFPSPWVTLFELLQRRIVYVIRIGRHPAKPYPSYSALPGNR
jgi:hypothetical protein